MSDFRDDDNNGRGTTGPSSGSDEGRDVSHDGHNHDYGHGDERRRYIPENVCSFCGKSQEHVGRLVVGPGGVSICDECLELCSDIVAGEQDEPLSSPLPALDEVPTPREIHAELSKYVIGQEAAKRALAVAVYSHYKRISLDELSDPIDTEEEEVELSKSNILMLGPTGSGKTLLAQSLARILQVPFAIADATALTEAGYVGEDVENILLKLITAADFDIPRAEVGIIYIDEIDKVARKAENLSITRDVSGEGVQQALLKILEGTEAAVPPQGGRKHPQQELLHIDTTNILFILGGAFVGLDKIIGERIGKRGVGFNAEVKDTTTQAHADLMHKVLPEDLTTFGMIPEFVGRIPVITTVDELSESDLVRILTEPKNALVKQYKRLFALEGVSLVFEDDALTAIANRAIAHKTGARGLRSICESILLNTMYELPDAEDIESVIVTEACITQDQEPTVVRATKGKKKKADRKADTA